MRHMSNISGFVFAIYNRPLTLSLVPVQLCCPVQPVIGTRVVGEGHLANRDVCGRRGWGGGGKRNGEWGRCNGLGGVTGKGRGR